jgi:hypothetical protein
MIFTSESGLTDPARESDWDRWYVDHLDIMVSVAGVDSAQRFRTSTPGHPPSLAMYTVASADVFQRPYYQSIRGMGEWLPLIDRRYYRRNLFDGAAQAPEVGEDSLLIVADRGRPEPGLAKLDWTWLECVGIDRLTPYRGIAVVAATQGRDLDRAHAVAVYRPVTARSTVSSRGKH